MMVVERMEDQLQGARDELPRGVGQLKQEEEEEVR
jgi:hypothetical protein